MDIFAVIYGVIGLLTGWKIPELSLKIMEYKRGSIELSNTLYSKTAKYVVCLLNGAAWALAGLNTDNPIIALLIAVQITICVIIAFIDINIRIIPNECVLLITVAGLLFQVMNYGIKALFPALISMVIMMTVFTSVAAFVGFGKVGAGDVKLAGAMGLALGYPLIITGVGIMALSLLAFIAVGMALKKIALATMLPLAPFITAGYAGVLITLLIA